MEPQAPNSREYSDLAIRRLLPLWEKVPAGG